MPNARFSVDQPLLDPLTQLVVHADKRDERDVRRVFADAAPALNVIHHADKRADTRRHILAGLRQ